MAVIDQIQEHPWLLIFLIPLVIILVVAFVVILAIVFYGVEAFQAYIQSILPH